MSGLSSTNRAKAQEKQALGNSVYPERARQAPLWLAWPGLWLWGSFPTGFCILGIFLCFRASMVNWAFQHHALNQDCPCLPQSLLLWLGLSVVSLQAPEALYPWLPLPHRSSIPAVVHGPGRAWREALPSVPPSPFLRAASPGGEELRLQGLNRALYSQAPTGMGLSHCSPRPPHPTRSGDSLALTLDSELTTLSGPALSGSWRVSPFPLQPWSGAAGPSVCVASHVCVVPSGIRMRENKTVWSKGVSTHTLTLIHSADVKQGPWPASPYAGP